jgi:hypothetical protein
VVSEKGEDGDDCLGRDVDRELVLVDRELLDVFGETGGEVLAIFVERGAEAGRLVCRVDADRLRERGDGRF